MVYTPKKRRKNTKTQCQQKKFGEMRRKMAKIVSFSNQKGGVGKTTSCVNIAAQIAKKGKIRGWSFGMHNVVDTLEQRTDDLPLRRIKELDLDHLTLVVKKQPCYAATSVEVRADVEDFIENRAFDENVELIVPSAPGAGYYASYQKRIDNL